MVTQSKLGFKVRIGRNEKILLHKECNMNMKFCHENFHKHYRQIACKAFFIVLKAFDFYVFLFEKVIKTTAAEML